MSKHKRKGKNNNPDPITLLLNSILGHITSGGGEIAHTLAKKHKERMERWEGARHDLERMFGPDGADFFIKSQIMAAEFCRRGQHEVEAFLWTVGDLIAVSGGDPRAFISGTSSLASLVMLIREYHEEEAEAKKTNEEFGSEMDKILDGAVENLKAKGMQAMAEGKSKEEIDAIFMEEISKLTAETFRKANEAATKAQAAAKAEAAKRNGDPRNN